MKKLLLPFALVACGACMATAIELSMPMQPAIADEIDFTALRKQANTALEKLQQQRLASINAVATF